MKINNLLETTIASMPEPGQQSFRSGRSETSLEEMTAGSVASVAMPMGKVIKRESGITKGIKKKMVDEGELSENDIIVMPGQMSKRPSGFMSKDRNEMERIEMAKSDVVQSVKSATAIFSILKNSNDEVEGWVQEKLAKAEDYLDTVREYLEGKSMPAEGMSAGVRMQRALQREKEKRERSERYAEKHFPIGKKPEPINKEKEVNEAGENPQAWMDELRAMAHKMAPQDKMRERQAERDAQAKSERQQRIQQDIENLPDLISQYNDMEAEYESMGGKNWQYADREQNLSDEERKARGMETSMRQLADRIHTAKKASEGLAESKPDFAKMFNKKIGKHNAAVVKTKKEIGTRVADIGAGGKEYNVKTDKEWDKQKGVAEGVMYGDEEVSWEKGGTRAPTGAFRNPAVKKVVFSGTGDDGGKYEVIQSGPDDYMIHANGKHIDTYSSLQRAMSVLKNEVSGLKKSVDEESKGLWANIHAKRDRIKHGSGEKMRKPGSKGAPTADALRKSAK